MATAKETATIDDLKSQIERLREDMEGLTAVIGGIGRGAASEGGAQAREALGSAGEIVRDAEAQAMAYVREKPVQAVLLAAGLGMVLGLLTRR